MLHCVAVTPYPNAIALATTAEKGTTAWRAKKPTGKVPVMGYTLMLAKRVGVLADDHPPANAYYERLQARAGFRIAMDA